MLENTLPERLHIRESFRESQGPKGEIKIQVRAASGIPNVRGLLFHSLPCEQLGFGGADQLDLSSGVLIPLRGISGRLTGNRFIKSSTRFMVRICRDYKCRVSLYFQAMPYSYQ